MSDEVLGHGSSNISGSPGRGTDSTAPRQGSFAGRLSRAFSSKQPAPPDPPSPTTHRRKSGSESPLIPSSPRSNGSPGGKRELSPMRKMSEANEALGQLRRRVVGHGLGYARGDPTSQPPTPPISNTHPHHRKRSSPAILQAVSPCQSLGTPRRVPRTSPGWTPRRTGESTKKWWRRLCSIGCSTRSGISPARKRRGEEFAWSKVRRRELILPYNSSFATREEERSDDVAWTTPLLLLVSVVASFARRTSSY